MTITEGAIIGGKFKLERPLAQGGMGSVWVARHQLLDTNVAVKFMEKSIAENESARQRFEREAKAAALIKSPHVVQVLDYGIEDGAPYIAMELLDGEDLDHRLARGGPLTIDKAYVILEQVGKALRRAHELGIVHRDLKPSNIFLSKHGDEELVKILDFGIAKDITATTSASATSTGALMGSPSYMSPEQIRETKQVDHRSDLWSMGVILYEVLTGRLPFDESENIGKLLVSICTDPVLPPSVLVPTFNVDVDRFFEKALSRDRNTRFQTMSELVDAFGVCAGVRPGRTTLLIGNQTRDSVPDRNFETEKTLSLDPVMAKSVDRASSTRLDGPETRGSLAPSESGDHGGSSRKKFVPIVLGLVAVAAGLGLAVALRNPGAGTVKATEPENTASKPTAEVQGTAPSVATAAALKEVVIRIDPSDASVEVAGRLVPVSPDGTITISGELGSSHPVRIFKDKLEFRTEVAIMAKGPSPDRLALPAKPIASTLNVAATVPVVKTKDPVVPPTTTATTTATTATTKTTKTSSGEPGPDRDFK